MQACARIGRIVTYCYYIFITAGILYSFRIQYDAGSIYVTRGTEHINLHEVLVRVSYGLQKQRMYVQAYACMYVWMPSLIFARLFHVYPQSQRQLCMLLRALVLVLYISLKKDA